MKKNKNDKAVFPIATLTPKKWWENSKPNSALTKGGSIATQEQCSCNGNGGGGGVGTCGGKRM